MKSFLQVKPKKKSKEADITQRFFDYDFHSETRTVYLGEATYTSEGSSMGIDPAVAKNFIKGLHILNSSSNQSIRVVMSSPGGSIFEGFAIYDAIRASPSPVDIEVLGQALSMAAIILQAGRKRLLHPNALFMMHEGYMDLGRLTPRAQQSWAEWSRRDNTKMYEIFADRSGRTPKFWEDLCLKEHDKILSADKVVEYGLADRVLLPAKWVKY